MYSKTFSIMLAQNLILAPHGGVKVEQLRQFRSSTKFASRQLLSGREGALSHLYC